MPKKELRPRSSAPFEISARRLAALHAQLSEWTRILENNPKYEYLADKLNDAAYVCMRNILNFHSSNSARYRIALAIFQLKNGSIEVTRAAEIGGVSVHVASNYLQAFVREGWAKRIRRGTYALKV